MKALILKSLVSLPTFLPIMALAGTTYHVSPGGVDAPPPTGGSYEQPFKHIAYGCQFLKPRDTLSVWDGVYDERLLNAIPSGTPGNPVTVRADRRHSAVIKPHDARENNFPVRFTGAHDIVFDGFCIDAREYTSDLSQHVTFRSSHHITVQNCEMVGGKWVESTSTSHGIASDPASHHLTIANNTIHDIGMEAPPGSRWRPYGMYFTSSDCVIENNDIYLCSGYGIHNYNTMEGAGSRNIWRGNRIHDNGCSGVLFAAGGNDNLFYNNLVCHNGTIPGRGQDGIVVGGYGCPSTNNAVYNNIFYDNAGTAIVIGSPTSGPAHGIVRNNICWKNGSDKIVRTHDMETVMDHNLMGVDPLFGDAAAGDFHPLPGSKAIDGGVSVPEVKGDLDGTPRPQGRACDIGPYEDRRTVTWYVDSAKGVDAPPPAGGTSEKPFRHVAYGCRFLKPGDTLILRDGVYDERLINVFPSGSPGRPVTLRAEHQREAVIKPTNDEIYVLMLTDCQYVTLDGLVIDAKASPSVATVHIGCRGTSHHITIENCEIRYGKWRNSTSDTVGITAAPTTHHLTVRSNLIHDMGMDAKVVERPRRETFYSYGMYFCASDSLVEANEIYRCSGYGIHMYLTAEGKGRNNVFRGNRIHDCGEVGLLIASGGHGCVACNNVIFGNGWMKGGHGQTGLQVSGAGASSSDNLVYNNTVYGNVGPGIQLGSAQRSGPTNTVVRNNISWKNGRGDFVQNNAAGTVTDHNLFGVDPRFVHPEVGDFTLQAESPAIGAGAAIATVTNDFAGKRRPAGQGYDLGAFER